MYLSHFAYHEPVEGKGELLGKGALVFIRVKETMHENIEEKDMVWS